VTTPEVIAVGSPGPNAAGWNNVPVAVVFSGTDAVSGVAHCSSSFTVAAEGRDIPVSGYCADYAGWTSTAVLTLNIDMTPPLSSAALSGGEGRNGWYVSSVMLTLVSSDSLSGLSEIHYSTRDVPALYSSPV
jgi:hypothetical protein